MWLIAPFQLLNNSEHFNQPKRRLPLAFLSVSLVSSLLFPVVLHKSPGKGTAWLS